MTTLATFKAQVVRNLMDTTNLIWPEVIVEEAIRASLADISRAYDDQLFVEDLDGAGSTTVEVLDHYLLVKGAVAHALIFRTVGRFEESTPEGDLTPQLALLAEKRMDEFKYYLIPIYAEHGTFMGEEERMIWQSAENVLDRALTVSENALDRQHEIDKIMMQYSREDALTEEENARLEELQESDETPFSAWPWNEGKDFA